MATLFALKDFASYPRLRWAAVAFVASIIVFVVFISCLQSENIRCSTISGFVGLITLCITTWNGLIYIAQRRGGY